MVHLKIKSYFSLSTSKCHVLFTVTFCFFVIICENYKQFELKLVQRNAFNILFSIVHYLDICEDVWEVKTENMI